MNALAAKAARQATLDSARSLVTAYYTKTPDPAKAAHRVAFGTSGHHGSPLDCRFNEAHVLAISQAICDYRRRQAFDGPLFIGTRAHALSVPTFSTALEVLAANEVEVVLLANDERTPARAVSQAIRAHNRRSPVGLADGIVIAPPRNRPAHGRIDYHLPRRDANATEARRWIETAANDYLRWGPASIRRLEDDEALARWDAVTRERSQPAPHRSLYAAPP